MRALHALVVASCVALAACSVLFPIDVTGGAPADGGSNSDAIADASDVIDGDAGNAGDGADAGDASNACARRGDVPDLVGYYPLDEGSGTTVRDCSGRGHDGQILRAGATTWASGKFGSAVSVASPDGCIDFGTPADFEFAGPFTVMAWVNIRDYPSAGTFAILGKSTMGFGSGWRMHTSTVDELGAGVAVPGNTQLFAGVEPQPRNVWRHLTIVFIPNDRFSVYIDGALLDEQAWGSALIEDRASALRAGCRSDNSGFIDGIIDELRLYARALSAGEIASLSSPQ